jgi:alkanesulfonate monooxygenase SsuD/methylene tetrahydromethanopterin reductase-like flavin-dependent oxidoreductase (luciferase family)
VQTLDIVSNGRVEFGIGASWLEEEWVVAQLEFATRGRRVDEALEVCKRLWTESEVSFDGEFFSFEGAVFEPKCVQQPYPPVLVGGESAAALRRAARAGDGWIGMNHDLESGARQIEQLRRLLAEQGRDSDSFEYCLGGPVESRDDVAQWEEIGVTRLVIAPWRRSREAIGGMRAFADSVGLESR